MMCTGDTSPRLSKELGPGTTSDVRVEDIDFSDVGWVKLLDPDVGGDHSSKLGVHCLQSPLCGAENTTDPKNNVNSNVNSNEKYESEWDLSSSRNFGTTDSQKVQIVNSNCKKKKRKESTAEEVISGPLLQQDPAPSPAAPAKLACQVCGKDFSKQWVLDKHVASAHNLRNMICQKVCKCGKTIPKTDTSHVCFGCNSCELYFTRKIFLKEHLLLCKERKELLCDVCNKSFNDKNNLINHEIECKLQHPGSAVKESPITCSRCGNVVRNIMMLHRHAENASLLSHTCYLCRRSFCTYGLLTRHYSAAHPKSAKIYNGFECPLCNRKFHIMKKYMYHMADIHETNTNNSWLPQPKSKYRKSVYTPKKWLLSRQIAERKLYKQKLSELPLKEYSQIGFLKRTSDRVRLNDDSLSKLIGHVTEPKEECSDS